MKDEIRQAVPLPQELEDKLFDLQGKAYNLFENNDFAQAKEVIQQCWTLLPEPKYNTSCTGMVLRAMHDILTKTGDYNYLEELLSLWIADEENSGYKIYDVEPFILLAEVYLFKNNIDKAKEQFAKAKKHQATKRSFAEKPAFYFDIMQGKITDNTEIERLFREAMASDSLNPETEEITEEMEEEIDTLAEEGNVLFDEEKYTEAIAIWQKALALVPEPQVLYGQSLWLETSIGDAYFMQNNFQEAFSHFKEATHNVASNGYGNPFICLHLGQCYFELKDFDNAKEFLLRAYMLEGDEIFTEEDPKYFEFLKENIDLGA